MQVRRNTDFTGWPSTEGQTGSQHALEGKTMRNITGKEAGNLEPGDVIRSNDDDLAREVAETFRTADQVHVTYTDGFGESFYPSDAVYLDTL